jgi:hypothetical protein
MAPPKTKASNWIVLTLKTELWGRGALQSKANIVQMIVTIGDHNGVARRSSGRSAASHQIYLETEKMDA